ncbi:MAG: hypothetical protein Q8Q59_15765 [Luteolibacter sp.]|nr:hypothetical protein [Luteolibacter sp.]
MADGADRKIKIGVETTANTSGTDAAEAGVRKLTAAEEAHNARKAQFLTAAEAEVAEVERMVSSSNRMAIAKEEEARAIVASAQALAKEQAALDLIEAKRRVSARGVTMQSGEIKNLGMVATQVGYQVTDFATQVSMGTSAVTAFAMQAPQAIGAMQQMGGSAGGLKGALSAVVSGGTFFSLVLTELAIGSKLVIDAWRDMKKAQQDLAESGKRAAEQQVFMADSMAKLARSEALKEVADNSARVADDLERQVAALTRINELRGAQGSAEQAQAQRDVTIAKNTGGDVAGAQGNALETGLRNELDALESKRTEAEARAVRAQADADAAVAYNLELRKEKDFYSDKYLESIKRIDDTAKVASEAKLDLVNETAKFEQEKAAIIANSEAGLSDLKTGVDTSLKAALTKTRDEIAAQAEAQGGELSASARTAYQKLNAILADGIVSEAEIAQIGTTMQLLKNSNEQVYAQVFTGVDKLVTQGLAAQAKMKNLERRIADLEANQ